MFLALQRQALESQSCGGVMHAFFQNMASTAAGDCSDVPVGHFWQHLVIFICENEANCMCGIHYHHFLQWLVQPGAFYNHRRKGSMVLMGCFEGALALHSESADKGK